MAENKSEDSSSRKPFAYVSDSLHKVDALMNSTREDLVKRLREGSNALEERKRKLFPEQSQHTHQQQDGTAPRPALPRQKREFRPPRFKRDREYADIDAQNLLTMLSRTPGARTENAAPQTTVQKSARLPFRLLVGGDLAEATPVQCSKQAWQRTLENCQENWSTLAQRLQQRLPRFNHPQLPQLPKGRFKFVTLRGSNTPEGEPARPDVSLSLEEILKPFAGLSQLLGSREGFTTLDELNKIVSKAAEELEAMREDKLNDGRPLGPLQKEALKRKRERALRTSRSSLRTPGRHVAIYTTASLPWMTGTAVNPLLRAAYLAKDPNRKVTLVIPWLAKMDQQMVFPNGITFDSPEGQEAYVRNWVKQRTGMDCNFNVRFYPGRYATEKYSILPVGDPTAYIDDAEVLLGGRRELTGVQVTKTMKSLVSVPSTGRSYEADTRADVAVLEEPEHLNWYHHGRRWTDKFRHVVGVIHTNYLDYALREEDGEAKAKALAIMNQLVCRMHCHKVVKLSDAVQPLPRQTTAFVHGVPHSFIQVGEEKAQPPPEGQRRFDNGAYFIGKAIWAKGYTELLDLMDKHTKRGRRKLHIDCYGSGEDLEAMKSFARSHKLDMAFHGARDHLDVSMHGYRVFVNPSTSDVVATTTAEALAMGKWVVVQDLPCNRFFSTFSNCLTYKTPEEFSSKLEFAMKHDPHPMKEEERRRLTWEAATERFLDVSELKGEERSPPVSAAIDTLAFNLHNYLTGLEALRAVSGAGVNTRDNPIDIKDFVPSTAAAGGFFDDKKRALARAAKAAS